MAARACCFSNHIPRGGVGAEKNEACPSNGNFAPECMRMSRKVTNLRGKQKAASSLCRPDEGAAGSRSAE